MSEEPKALLTCLVFLGRECTSDGLAPAHYWLQSASKAWCRPAPSAYPELEGALRHLSSSIRIHFEHLPPAQSRGSQIWALRLGITEADEAELDREWISVPVQVLNFQEPVEEGDCVQALCCHGRHRGTNERSHGTTVRIFIPLTTPYDSL